MILRLPFIYRVFDNGLMVSDPAVVENGLNNIGARYEALTRVT
jgi:hypothetical protein